MAELNGNINIDVNVNNIGSIEKVDKYLRGAEPTYDIEWDKDFLCGEQKHYVLEDWCPKEIKVNRKDSPNIPTREEIEKKLNRYTIHDIFNDRYTFNWLYTCEDGYKIRSECSITTNAFCCPTREEDEDRVRKQLYAINEVVIKAQNHYRKKNEEETRNMISKPNVINMTEKEMRDFNNALRMIHGTLEIECPYSSGLGDAKLTFPAEYLRFIKIDMLTTDFCVSKRTDTNYSSIYDELRRKMGMNKNWIDGLPAIKRIDTYNDRVVKVTFIDDTFTKSVCSENDHFDLDVGITICCMKRIMGKDGNKYYNDIIRHAHKVIIENDKKKAAEAKEKAERKLKDRKEKLKKAAKKLKAKEEQIDIQTQAIIRAHCMIEDDHKEEGLI